MQITIKTYNDKIHMHERYSKSTKDSPKNLLKRKLNSIGVLNIEHSANRKTKTKNKKQNKTKRRPAQKT